MDKKSATLSFEHFALNEYTNELNSLFVNFYVVFPSPHTGTGTIAQLKNCLFQTIQFWFSEKKAHLQPSKNFDGWYCDQWEIFRHFFVRLHEPVKGSDDTFIVQAGLSTALPCQEGWPRLKEIIKDIFAAWKSAIDTNDTNTCRLLGYTLIYKSNILARAAGHTGLDEPVLQTVQPLFSTTATMQIAYHRYNNGTVFLVRAPKIPDVDPCIIYLSLGIIGSGNKLFTEQFYHPNMFMTVDKYVHKAFFQWLLIKGEDFFLFDRKLSTLADTTTALLAAVKATSRKQSIGKEIENTAGSMTAIMASFTTYKRLELSLDIQKKNLELAANDFRYHRKQENEIYAFYVRRVAGQSDDCRLSLDRGEIILEQTKVAINLTEAQQSKISNDKSSRLQLELAIVGACLAFIQVFDNEAAAGVLKSLRIVMHQTTTSEINWAILFMTKFLFTSTLALFILFLYRWWKRK